jgi:membrane associated rhomboid family serine protease
MPLHQAITAFGAALLLAFVVAIFRPRLEAELGRLRFWLVLMGCAGLASAASWLVAETGHAGTGFVTRHGWPKPWWFDFVGEHGDRSTSLEPLYFAGNMLAHASVLLLAWSLWRLLGGRRIPEGR